jgi:hypothetical protein
MTMQPSEKWEHREMSRQFGAMFAMLAALVVVSTWITPASAQQCLCGRPPERNVYDGLLAEDFTPVDASAAFNPTSLNGAKLAIIASANFNEYARRWVHWYGEGEGQGNIERYWAYRLNSLDRDTTRPFEQNTDPRGFADQLVALLEPHVAEVIVAPDFQQAREQGATYYLVVDVWLGTPNFMNSSWKTWAGAYLLDSSLQRVFESSAEQQVSRGMQLVGSVIEADARSSRESFRGATEPVIAALRARLGQPPTSQEPAPGH